MLTQRFASHAALAAFYRRVLESPNFLAWFERRRGAAWAWQVSSPCSQGHELARTPQSALRQERQSARCDCVRMAQAAEWAEAARERGEGPDMAGRPEVEMVEAFSEHERHLEAALAAARAPGATPEVRINMSACLALAGDARRRRLFGTRA